MPNSRDSEVGASQRKRALAAAFIGTVIEWYDYFLYGTAAALVFGKLFFPKISPSAATMAAFGTYAVGFFVRPLGGILFGYLGDRLGRKSTLIWTLSSMGAATFLIGCLPTYASAGFLAAGLLVLLRCIQGLALGGEWGGAVLMTVEHSFPKDRGFAGSWAQAGVPIGLILANGVFALSSSMNESAFFAWGWRIPFWGGIILTTIGLVIRSHVEETPLFLNVQRQGKRAANPIVSVFKDEKRSLLLIVGARMAENGSFYIFTVFILAYCTTQLGMGRAAVLNGVLIASAIQFGAILLAGFLSDRVGRRKVYLFGALMLTIGIFPFFAALNSGSVWLTWLALALALSLAHAPMYAPQAAFFSELFKTNVRYSGASLGYSLSAPLAGGLAPLIAAYLLEKQSGKPWFVAFYVMMMGIITIVAVAAARETRSVDMTEP